MNKTKKILSSILIAGLFLISDISAATTFSGFAGGKLNYGPDTTIEEYKPNLRLQAFFAGQFNFSQNAWSHLEFSIDTEDFINESIFHQTPAAFQIDEISFIIRGNLENVTNYFSAFMGTYDPIGSDLFLQRYFGINSIASKITDSYLGLAGSILYPHFGVGISDVLKLHTDPLAFGGYMYINNEDSKYYVFNSDLRSAGVYRNFIWDFAFGIGVPLADKYKGEDVIIAIEKVYWHAGTTLLIGNNFTNSLFMQAGLYNAAFTAKNDDVLVSPKDLYILFEPRFIAQNFHFNFTLYSLPANTVQKLLFVDDTLGIDFNFYSDSTLFGATPITFGAHASISFTDKCLFDVKDINNIAANGYNLNITPYITNPFLSGELHIQAKIRIMALADNPAKAFSADLGYRTKF